MSRPEYRDFDDIKEDGQLLLRVKFKPIRLFTIFAVISFIMAVVGYIVPLKWIFVSGVAGLFYMMFSIFSIPDRWVCYIYDDAIIFLSAEPVQRGFRVAAKDIVEYSIGKKEKDTLHIKLRNGSEYQAKSYNFDAKAKEALAIALPGKEK